MSKVAIIQARMDSTRLPGKVLLPLKGKPVLWHVVNRLKACKNIDKIVIATSEEKNDDEIACFCKENKIDCFRGSKKNILERYYFASKRFEADHIIRITADCPVLDSKIIDELIAVYEKDDYDFYGVGSGFPDGINGAIFSYKALEDSYLHAELPSEKEHVGLYIKKRPNEYKVGFYEKYKDLGEYRWTLDTEEDYSLIKKIYDALYKEEKLFLMEEIVAFIESHPELKTINKNTVRDEGLFRTLKEDEDYLKTKANSNWERIYSKGEAVRYWPSEHLIRILNKIKKGKLIVDLGAGTGRNMEALLQKLLPDGVLIMVEISESGIEKAVQLAEKYHAEIMEKVKLPAPVWKEIKPFDINETDIVMKIPVGDYSCDNMRYIFQQKDFNHAYGYIVLKKGNMFDLPDLDCSVDFILNYGSIFYLGEDKIIKTINSMHKILKVGAKALVTFKSTVDTRFKTGIATNHFYEKVVLCGEQQGYRLSFFDENRLQMFLSRWKIIMMKHLIEEDLNTKNAIADYLVLLEKSN